MLAHVLRTLAAHRLLAAAVYTAAVFSMALLYCHFPASLLPRCSEALRCAAGKDKVENEDLIKWGLPHDVW